MIFGLTGGIGCGKSTVSKFLKKNGYKIVDADIVSRQIYEYEDVCKKVEEVFPSAFTDGVLDRRKLSKIVFSDEKSLNILNNITKDRYMSILKDELKKSGNRVVLDAALLFESRLDDMVDKVIVVRCDRDVQIERVMKRDGRTRDEIENIIDSQMPQKEKVERGDYILDNSFGVENLDNQLAELLKKMEDYLDNEL